MLSQELWEKITSIGSIISCKCGSPTCEDYLDIPTGAVPINKSYEISQPKNVIVCHDAKDWFIDNYVLVFINEFVELTSETFQKHVRITLKSKTPININYPLIIKFKGNSEHIIEIQNEHKLYSTEKPDQYFSIVDNEVIIYTKQLGLFVGFGVSGEFVPSFSCEPLRNLALAADIYYKKCESKIGIDVFVINILKTKDLRNNDETTDWKVYKRNKRIKSPKTIDETTELSCEISQVDVQEKGVINVSNSRYYHYKYKFVTVITNPKKSCNNMYTCVQGYLHRSIGTGNKFLV